MSEAASRTISVAGLETHYLEAGSGPPLVLVHGGGAGADSWGNWRQSIPLYADDFHVMAVDMIGFGRSAKPDPVGYEYNQTNRTAHLIGFIEALKLGPVNLIGNSVGGMTSLGATMQRPDLVKKLVLMGSAGLEVDDPNPNRKKPLTGYDFTLEGMRAITSVLVGPGFKVDEELIRYRHEQTLQPDTRRALAAIRAATQRDGLAYPEDEIRAVKTPTLVVGGKEDQIAILARTYRFLALLENSWGMVFPHCGHWVMVEAPREFVAVTCSFLQSDMFQAPTT
jgi:2-hydroxy-6-oxo-6-(2'-aminophenyl)hexa-2,4-dienoate hydrolase